MPLVGNMCLLINPSIVFQDKKSLSLGPDDSLHLEGFALSVFAKADKQDHAGRADLYVNESMIFLHIEKYFNSCTFS